MRSTNLLALVLVLSACGGAPPAPPPAAGDPDLSRAEADAIAQLRQTYADLFGEHAALYAGDVDAHSESPLEDREAYTIDGRVAGWVAAGNVEGEIVLTLLEPDGEDLAEVWQQRDAPGASGFDIGDAWAWGGHDTPWTTGCASPLDGAPDTITLECASTADHEGADAHLRGTVHRAAWHELGVAGLFACMQRLNGEGEHAPERDGDRIVLPIAGAIDAGAVPSGPPDHPACTRTRSYEGVLAIDPGRSTLRAEVQLAPARTTCCAPSEPRGACSPGVAADCITLP